MVIEEDRANIFVEHIRKHLFEDDAEDKRPYCKICNKPMDKIIQEETLKGIWIAGGIYLPEYVYIDRNGKRFKMIELK